MELYSNVYQYLKQKKMQGYWKMKKSGELSWTDKIDLHDSFMQAVCQGLTDNKETAVQEKLAGIRAKLSAGSRLSGAEKEYLRKHDPQLYMKVTELEREQDAYEDRLKKCRTRDDAERAKLEKLAELSVSMKEEDAEYMIIRYAQMREIEKKTALLVAQKPWQQELDKKRLETYKKNREREDKKIKEKKAKQRRREKEERKKKIQEKIQQESLRKEEIRKQMLEEEKVKELVEENREEEERVNAAVVSELTAGREMTAEQVAKCMIAAGMMDKWVMEVRMPGAEEPFADSAPSVPSLGNTSGYAAYRAAVCMPEIENQEEEKNSYIRRA